MVSKSSKSHTFRITRQMFVIAAIIMVVLIIIWNAGYQLCKRAYWIPPDARQVSESAGLLLGPGKIDVRCPTSDGSYSPGWYHPGTNGACVILLHGLGGTRSQLADVAQFMLDAGYGVLLLDQRGHGEHPLNMTTFGRAEALDALAGVQWLRARDEVDPGRIGLFGSSMGAATAIHAAFMDNSIGCVIADSSYASITDQARHDLQYKHSPIRVPPGLHAMVLSVFRIYEPIFIGKWANVSDPVDVIKDIKCPLFLIHGENDDRISPDDLDRLFNEAVSNGLDVEKWKVYGGGHCSYHWTDEFKSRILAFLDSNL